MKKITKSSRIYSIGDIHGRSDLLEKLLKKIQEDVKKKPVRNNTIIFLGDYIDRGKNSKKVVELIINLSDRFKKIFLKGNHEDMLNNFLKDPNLLDIWLVNGGDKTLINYGVNLKKFFLGKKDALQIQKEFLNKIPRRHLHFLKSLKHFYQISNYFFTHAGVRPNIKLSKQNKKDLMWIREPFLSSKYDFGKIIVHGHTPSYQPEVKSNRIGIDTCAHITNLLTSLVIEENKLRFIQT